MHDIFWVLVFLTLFSVVVFFAPEGWWLSPGIQQLPADPLKTPEHIAPVWYFTPFYSMLRATTDALVTALCVVVGALGAFAIVRRVRSVRNRVLVGLGVALAIVLLKTFDAKFWGVGVMGSCVVLLYFVPWLDRSPVRSIRYRPTWHKAIYGGFVLVFLVLGYLGTKPPTVIGTYVAQVLTIAYFSFFLSMPIWSRRGAFKTLPVRVAYKPH